MSDLGHRHWWVARSDIALKKANSGRGVGSRPLLFRGKFHGKNTGDRLFPECPEITILLRHRLGQARIAVVTVPSGASQSRWCSFVQKRFVS